MPTTDNETTSQTRLDFHGRCDGKGEIFCNRLALEQKEALNKQELLRHWREVLPQSSSSGLRAFNRHDSRFSIIDSRPDRQMVVDDDEATAYLAVIE